MIYFLIIIVCAYLIIDYKKNKNIVSPLTAFSLPYTLVIFINNTYAIKYGFYIIEDSVIGIVSLGITMFFIGNSLIPIKVKIRLCDKKRVLTTEEKLSNINLGAMIKYTIIIEMIVLSKVLYVIYRYGFSRLSNGESDILMGGLVGHLMLTLYVTLPILLLNGLIGKRKRICLVLYIIGIFIFFLTFIKYHVICLTVASYLFICFENKKFVKAGTLFVVFGCIAFFIINYIISFFISGVLDEVSDKFYFMHLWKYLAGSIIRDNNIFNNASQWISMDFFYKIATFVSPLPNMFLNKLGLNPIFPLKATGMLRVTLYGSEESNANDLIGYLYSNNAGMYEVIAFCLFFICFGWICRNLYDNCKNGSDHFSIFSWYFFTFFCFFAFFGIYGVLSNTWEILLLSLLLPKIFKINYRVK